MAAGGAIGGMLTSFVGMVTSEEEQLANVMQEIGPFIAIGRPGENLPELGATRVYVSDAEWQEKVRELISRARLVVLRAGSTAGFWWEVERVARDVSPEKLLFLLPYDAAQYGVFRQRLQAYLPCQLPPYPEGGAHIGSVRGILFFQPDWTPHLARVKQSGQSVDWVREFKRSLEPVFNQLQVKTKKPTSDLAHGAWVVLYFLIGLAALVLITWIMSLFER
jgi:hypothetical protein